MSFATAIAKIPVTAIMAALGCPRSTAYEWKDGRREPPAWQHQHWLAIIRAATKAHQSAAANKRRISRAKQ